MTKTLWIIDHYASEPKYGGYTRQFNFAKGLSAKDINVVVIASSYSHFKHEYISNEDFTISEVSNSVHFVYLKTAEYHDNTSPRRFLGMVDFYKKVKKNASVLADMFGKPNWIVASSPHPFTWVVGRQLARFYGARFSIEIRDFWPLELRSNNETIIHSIFYKVLDTIETKAFKSAENIICTLPYGDRYCDDLKKPCKNKFCIIGQPLDCDKYDKLAEDKQHLLPKEIDEFINNDFCCVFSGYYMRYEGVFDMLEAAKYTKDRGLNIKYVFVGSGEEKGKMIDFQRRQELSNVYIGDRIAKEAIPALLKRSSICMAYLYDKDNPEKFKYGMSKNKINEYLYSGAVTIVGFPEEKNEISESGGGLVFDPRINGFPKLIEEVYFMSMEERNQMGSKAREYMQKHHSVEMLTEKYAHEILKC